MKLKGLLSAVLGAAVMLTSAAAAFADTAANEAPAKTVDFTAPSVGLNITEHSRDVIRQYINGHPFDMTRKAEYAKAPDGYMPFANFGKLSDTDVAEGRNALNVMRFIAGVGVQDVTLCPYATEYAQAAALVLNHKGYLTHTIYNDMPGMDMWTLRCAQVGAKNSNLASGFNNPAHSVVMGYMYDTNEKNIGELGHRRWCLNPPMYLTAFGQVGNFGTMWATDDQLTEASNSGICWPAPNTPAEYFPADTAWSFSLCETVPADNVKVTLTRKSDMRVWTFSNERSDGYFGVNNDTSVPLYGCVIFRPDDVGGYSHGDVFNVNIEGLGKEVSYNVSFFALDGDDSVFDDAKEPEESDADNEPAESGPANSEPAESETTSEESKPVLEFKSEETDIQINADPEVFPEDTRFKAQPIESCCSATRFACDLSFICGGQTVQPNGSVRVSMPIPNGFESYRVLRVYHVEDGRCSFVPSTIENGRVCFMASSFSPYIITSEDLEGELIELSDGGSTAPENTDEVPSTDDPMNDPTEDPINDPENGAGNNSESGITNVPEDDPKNDGSENENGAPDVPSSENLPNEAPTAPENNSDNLSADDTTNQNSSSDVPALENSSSSDISEANDSSVPTANSSASTANNSSASTANSSAPTANSSASEKYADNSANNNSAAPGNPGTGSAAIIVPTAIALCAAIAAAAANKKKR